MKYLFGATAIAVLCVNLSMGAPASHAQPAGYMWCTATATNGNSVARYYSGVFAASTSESVAKAEEFKGAAEDAELSAAYIVANCYAAVDPQTAANALGAARSNADGDLLDWPN